MEKADIAALLALGAAFFIAAGDVMHQRSDQGHRRTGKPSRPVHPAAARSAVVAGSFVAGAGFALQAAALGFGSVLLVQAVLVTSLLFALLIQAWLTHHPVSRFQWIWAALLAVRSR